MTDQENIVFTEANDSNQQLADELAKKQSQLAQMNLSTPPLERADLQYDISSIMNELKRSGMQVAAWGMTKESFQIYMDAKHWEDAVRCCDLLYQTEQAASITALGNGLWLAVTYPIDPELSILMLHNLIDDTPNDCDGAAVAAATAHYIADMRFEGEKRDSTMFLTLNMLSKVAERHSQIDSQDKFNMWMQRLELNDPSVFIKRLGMVVDAIVADTWWYDREALRAELPVN
jgi:hypothetical protein